ncbi:DoxX family protein [Pradoshia sp.]
MEDMGILIVRLVVGGLFLAHGAQKLFGWFRGAGLVGTAGWFESIDIKPGFFMALMVGIIEFIGGLFLMIGLFTPFAAVLLAVTMICAIVKVHWQNGIWNTDNGYEYNLVLFAILAAIALIGAGKYAIDPLF